VKQLWRVLGGFTVIVSLRAIAMAFTSPGSGTTGVAGNSEERAASDLTVRLSGGQAHPPPSAIPPSCYFEGVDAVGAAVVLPAAGFACFFVFFTFFVVFVVLLLGVVEEAAGACAAITVPIIRDRPTKAEANVFMGSHFSFSGSCHSCLPS